MPRWPSSPPPRNWSLVPDLGIASDMEIARRLGVSHTTVQRARQSLGIAAAGQPRGVDGRLRAPVSGDCEGDVVGIDDNHEEV